MPTPRPIEPPGYKKPKTYIVRKGDTVEKIAGQFGLTDTQLIGANRGLRGFTPGVVLNIPEQVRRPNVERPGYFQNTFNIFEPLSQWAANIVMRYSTPESVNRGWSAIANAPITAPSSTPLPRKEGWIPPVSMQKTITYGQPGYMNYEVRTGGLPPDMRTGTSGLPPDMRSEEAATATTIETGGYQSEAIGDYKEKLPYGKSYNYATITGELASPGSVAAVKYGPDAEYNLAIARISGYGYDYGNYLKWADEQGIQQPASYYDWRSNQGITRSGQSTQFWEYMQGLSTGSSHYRNTTEEMLNYKEAKQYDPTLTYRKWKMRRYGKGRYIPATEPESEPETGNIAVQPDMSSYYVSRSGASYSSPSSFGLISWRL